MILQKDVHTLDDPSFRHVKGDDDDIVLREGTLRIACQLGENSSGSDIPVSVLLFLELLYLVLKNWNKGHVETKTVHDKR